MSPCEDNIGPGRWSHEQEVSGSGTTCPRHLVDPATLPGFPAVIMQLDASLGQSSPHRVSRLDS
eukprot:1852677-Amphidinium_carterae.1